MVLADVIITNPPFSLFREFIDLLMKHNKEFLVIGTNASVIYNSLFPLFKDNLVHYGYCKNKTLEFVVPDHYEEWTRIENGVKYVKVPAISWFTNLPVKNEKKLSLNKEFDKAFYQEFDNYKAINVNRIKDIPKNFFGEMAVPITFMNYLNEDFVILDANLYRKEHFHTIKKSMLIRDGDSTINGKATYVRVLIRRK